MATIGFIGLGNMGLPMAQNLIKAGHAVDGLRRERVCRRAAGRRRRQRGAASVADACKDAEIVITMLPAGEQVREVYLGDDGVLAAAAQGTLLIDSSTIDVETAREVAQAAPRQGARHGRRAGLRRRRRRTGGDADLHGRRPRRAFERAQPVLEKMGKTIVHAGGAGNGQAAKICNNMMLGASMIVVSEAFLLAEKLGLDAQKLFDIASKSSGQCWSMTSYCPVPGPVPASPANRDYQAGFHRGHDAQGLEAGASRRARDPCHDAARRGRGRGLRAIRRERRRRRGFLRHHSLLARDVTVRANSAMSGRSLYRRFPAQNFYSFHQVNRR